MIASAGFGTAFAYTQGAHHGPMLAACAVAMALGLELAKPFAIEATFSCLRTWAIGRALAMAALGLVAVAYSLTAELSLMATTRGDAAAERTKASTSVADDRAELARLLAERAAMPSFAPATGETVTAAREAVKAAATVRAAECSRRGPRCRASEADEAAARAALAKAIGDKAATDRAAKLGTDAATVRARLAKAGAVAGADPGAAALGGLLATFGVTVPATLVAQWLTLVGVIALELGSALAVVLVRASGGHRPLERHRTRSLVELSADSRAETQPAQPQRPSIRAVDSATTVAATKAAPKRAPAKAAKASAKSGRGRPPREREKAEAAILGQLKANGGTLPTSSPRKLGAMLSVRKSTAHSALLGLIAAGAVAKATGGLVLTAGA